ncbi:3-deoxy-manno-octulosonate cytidylyltransferase [Xylella fastidiosa]|uniref:3-deoxy-manno-octulosonate cytidylyltransferase n=1 Tax=Xylella fastidiosa (strain 9a5c) TaxID=160492 RepID=KDSB_XYLFA|nr:3-deoxy-manno-octulosonate cytidylyltransferase [Xylella fastidiosa]Q9PB46.1 RecName: Full=3-deoxy-manno-octulosonate cytidylyltransferase; AltName: Full=CMP-2-keto-3-deoxyoctulosonic acid synthase; Short=CKS; Short=CMP-KDO synthase [Xylella fastidiosa 9a5c]AAF85098.1 3-deoxy-manno-octulosonate cytidylyltransferase [Xylella fastidiosa 9a5c]ALQ95415.1 3-deoxy-manno-octulosonate cytidylyltransferase [Xylella fastidiosa]ALQ96578.1 3-deoxy-manno-octulosonate cytidylyltransferase [Xylella fastidi
MSLEIVPFVVAIPARFSASRLPGKPLRLLGGRPLIHRVAERALSAGAREVWVATDDVRIAEAVASLDGVHVAMTANTHLSGSDRLAECARIAGWDPEMCVVNLQGDEPFAPAAGIRAVAALLHHSNADMATLATTIDKSEDLFNPNIVKLVCNAHGEALYFSRAPIPWNRDTFATTPEPTPLGPWLRHIGLYACNAGFLQRFTTMQPGTLEQIESLEQLRVLEAGHRIAVRITPEHFPPGIDTPEDLARAEKALEDV